VSVFVFGSNLAGRHGAGAALAAKHFHGAIYGFGVGPQGNSYAIPTKGRDLKTLPLAQIKTHVADFLHYARNHPDVSFALTPIGCGLAGYTPEDIAPMFRRAPANVILPAVFVVALGR
jgi:hypothetical protein